MELPFWPPGSSEESPSFWRSERCLLHRRSAPSELRVLHFAASTYLNAYRKDLSYHVQQTPGGLLYWQLDDMQRQFVSPVSISMPPATTRFPPLSLPLLQIHASPNCSFIAAASTQGVGIYYLRRHTWSLMLFADQPTRVAPELPMGWVTDQLFALTATARTGAKCAMCGTVGKDSDTCWLCSAQAINHKRSIPRLGARKKAGTYRNMLNKDAKTNCPRHYAIFFFDVKRMGSSPLSHIDGLLHKWGMRLRLTQTANLSEFQPHP